MLSTINLSHLLASRATEIITQEGVTQGRRVDDVELLIERDYLALRIEIDRSPSLVHLGIRASSALGDVAAFEIELRRIVRLMFDARRAVERSSLN